MTSPDETVFVRHAELLRIMLQDRIEAAPDIDEDLAHRHAERADSAEQFATERHRAEARLQSLTLSAWAGVSREELAGAYGDALVWAQHSSAVQASLNNLRSHLRNRYGIVVTRTNNVLELDIATVSACYARAVNEAHSTRAMVAYRRVLEIITAADRFNSDSKASLSHLVTTEAAKWSEQPAASAVGSLDIILTLSQFPLEDLQHALFTSAYLLGSPQALPYRPYAGPLVDPSEQAKTAIDNLLPAFALTLREDQDEIMQKILDQTRLLSAHDQSRVEQQMVDLNRDPLSHNERLWPHQVDRAHIQGLLIGYASVLAIAERDVARLGCSYDELCGRRQHIRDIADNGRGLIDLERDQLRLCLADIDAGIGHPDQLPNLLFADYQSARNLDRARRESIAVSVSESNRQQSEQILRDAHHSKEAILACGSAFDAVEQDQYRLLLGELNHAIARTELEQHRDRLAQRMAQSGINTTVVEQVICNVERQSGQAIERGKATRMVDEGWREQIGTAANARAEQVLVENCDQLVTPQFRETLDQLLTDAHPASSESPTRATDIAEPGLLPPDMSPPATPEVGL